MDDANQTSNGTIEHPATRPSLHQTKPVVENAFVVVGPGHAAELDVFENVFQISSGFDVFELDLDPIGSALAQPVGEEARVIGERSAGQRNLNGVGWT